MPARRPSHSKSPGLVEAEMADGVALIDLMAVRERDTIALSLCEALGLVTQGPSPAVVLSEYLATRQTLIVLDNCEHLLPELGSVVDRLLDRCPDVRFLATSRSAMRVHGEFVFVVPPLPLPGVRRTRHLDDFARTPAVELFVERAQAVESDIHAGGRRGRRRCSRSVGVSMGCPSRSNSPRRRPAH